MQEKRDCQNCKKSFEIDTQDFEFYEKISDKNSEVKVPAPTWCPDCRVQRRMQFFNQTKLYKRKCDGTGKMIFTTISADYPGKVYDIDYWWSDNWDAIEYARDYDFNKPFFEQIKELSLDVPKFNRSVLDLVNSDYCAGATGLKNCYLIFNSDYSEDSAYGVKINKVKDSFDNYNLVESELCAHCFMVRASYKVFFSRHCVNCQEVYFSKNLKNCNNCFGCVNLRNKSYCIFNKQYTKEEYERQLEQFDLGSYKFQQGLIKQSEDLFLKFPVKFMDGLKNTNVSGDYINNSKDVFNSNQVFEGESCNYCYSVVTLKDCYDYTIWGENANNIYETVISGENISNLKFCCESYRDNMNLEYCINCMSCSDCFACVGLRKKQYCILNKQYTKEEYFKMVEKIKKHMNEMPYVDKQGREYKYGEFFPPELSPFAYNETIAQEYFPLAKEEAIKQGYRWKDPEERNYQITIEAKDLPDNIKDVDDSILKEVIGCATKKENRESTGCTTAFKIIPKELEFYKKMNLPIPRYCPNCRHHQRLKNRNPLKLYKRTCMKEGCNTEFETTYAPDRKEIVYCEKCYQQEVA